MKRANMRGVVLAALLCAAVLGGCVPATPSPQMTAPPAEATPAPQSETPRGEAPQAAETPAPTPMPPPLMSEEEYPRVDGSTATAPLAAALLSRACAIPMEEAELYVEQSKTAQAYYNLLNGVSDLLLVYEPPEAVRQYAADYDMNFDEDIVMAPIGRDALVFLTNAKNQVMGLTDAEIVSIYQGETLTWSEVGGADAEIAAFQRDPDSGSQTLMRKLVMKDRPMMEAEVEMTPSEMGELIEEIVEYDNTANALGYSVYYYVKNMVGMEGLKTLAVDGVEPSEDSIAGGAYPYTNDFYVAMRANEPEGSPARTLYDFMLSAEGKALISGAGYVALP